MKRLIALLVMVLCSSLLLYAKDDKGKDKDKGKGAGMTEMTGWVCNSKCVKTEGGKSTCDAGCKEKTGDMVFVDDEGKVTKIANPKSVKPNMMGQKVKAKAKMKGDEMQVMDIVLANAG